MSRVLIKHLRQRQINVRQTKKRPSRFIASHRASNHFGCHRRLFDHPTYHWRIGGAFREKARAHGECHGDFPGPPQATVAAKLGCHDPGRKGQSGRVFTARIYFHHSQPRSSRPGRWPPLHDRGHVDWTRIRGRRNAADEVRRRQVLRRLDAAESAYGFSQCRSRPR